MVSDLNINPDIVRHIIQNAREFHVKEEVTFPDKPTQTPEEYDYLQVLADHDEDLTYQETVREINKLEPDQQITLIALLYLGRGDYSIEEWTDAWEEAKSNWREGTGEYLMRHPLLADHLAEALTLMGYEVNDETE